MEHINLARSWRCRTFDQMIGQTVSIRILKNSLYRNYFVPIYLFAGLKGSGKTTLARIFAAALNCEQLASFQQDPKKQVLPCLSCTSCVHAAQGSHPDILEIDAASHTGVDHVRTIIDAAGLLPVLGKKRVYIIDEAHMLSKAAFNAFLKILEEPPVGVLFIMATTELSKILETVRSRSLQLFFTPIDVHLLTGHLQKVCQDEKIEHELQALERIAHEAHGSARDALNMLERVRLASERVTLAAVNESLGLAAESHVMEILSALVQRDEQAIVEALHEYAQEPHRVLALWKHIGELLSVVLTEVYTQSFNVLTKLNVPQEIELKAEEGKYLLQLWLEYDQIVLKGVSPYSVVQLALITMASRHKRTAAPAPLVKEQGKTRTDVPIAPAIQSGAPSAAQTKEVMASAVHHTDPQWQVFLSKIEGLNDPLLNSIFNQVHKRTEERDAGILHLYFSQDLSFFQDWLNSTQHTWQPLLNTAYSSQIRASFYFDQPVSKHSPVPTAAPVAAKSVQPPMSKNNEYTPQRSSAAPYEVKKKVVMRKPAYGTILRIADANEWPRAAALNEIFPGTIYIESSL